MRRISPGGIIRCAGVARRGKREKGGSLIPTYVTLFNWTDQGSRTVRDTVERVDRGAELAEEKYGVRLGQIYWTVGPYDLVSVFEAPDEQSIMAFLLELGSVGNVRTTTLRAYDREEISEIIGRLA